MTIRTYIALLLTTVLAACGQDRGEVASSTVAIVNGAATDDFPAVGVVVSAGFGCGGTLIGPRTVLTAAHCVDKGPGVSFRAGHMGGETYETASIKIHPNYAGGKKSDIAVIVLERDVQGITPLSVATVAPVVGEPVVLLGFGMHGEGAGQFGLKRQTENTVGQILDQTFSFFGTDGTSGNVCDGDSGGPTLAVRNGKPIVIGVHSTKTGTCGQQGDDMRVDKFHQWIASVTNDGLLTSAATPSLDRNPQYFSGLALGESCEYGNQCASDLCIGAEQAYCSTTCNQNAQCPNGFSCSNNLCLPGPDYVTGGQECGPKSDCTNRASFSSGGGCSVDGSGSSSLGLLLLALCALRIRSRR